MLSINKIFNEDCVTGLQKINDSTIDFVVTSPPYNVNLNYNSYEDNKPYIDYLAWLTQIFSQCYRVLREDGRMAINIGDAKNGAIPTHSDIIQMCKGIGFDVLTTIIWNKNTTNNRTAWGSFMSPSAPSFPRCFEYILMFRKSNKLTHKGEPTISKEEFIKWSNGTWSFNTEKVKSIGHPACFPIELPTRCIKMLTYKNDIVLDRT